MAKQNKKRSKTKGGVGWNGGCDETIQAHWNLSHVWLSWLPAARLTPEYGVLHFLSFGSALMTLGALGYEVYGVPPLRICTWK